MKIAVFILEGSLSFSVLYFEFSKYLLMGALHLCEANAVAG